MGVGIAAFALRVRRDEKEAGRTFEETIKTLRRRVDLVVNSDEAAKAAQQTTR